VADEVLWEPQPKQQALIACPVEDVLFGGARGGGKSDGLLGDWLDHAIRYPQHAKGLLTRQQLVDMEGLQERAQDLFPAAGARWHGQSHSWRFPQGARLYLGQVKNDKQAQKYQGWNLTWIGVDEITQYPTSRPLDVLRATLRSAHGVPVAFRATANPGGPGHNWVKLRYIDPAPPMTPFVARLTVGDTTVETERVFIPSRLDDNPKLTSADPGYWQRVVLAAAGRPDLLKAWRYGLWDIVAGGMFDDLWSPDVHVLLPFAVPRGWRVTRSHDWGSAKPFCTLWFAESGGEQVALPGGAHRSWPRGHLFVIAEDYGWNGQPNEGLRLTATTIAERVKAAEQALGLRVLPGPADDPIFEVRNGQSMADDMAKVGILWEKPSKGPGSRVAGWNKIRELLENSLAQPQEKPGLTIFATCRNLLRTLPVLPRDDLDPDDCDTEAEDHACDALRLRVLQPKRQATAVHMTA
jgi:hypothetical protein